jgi:hypothetical protein
MRFAAQVARHVANAVAVIDQQARQVVLEEQFLLVVADDDQRIEPGAIDRLADLFDALLRFAIALQQPRRGDLIEHGGVGTLRQFLEARGLARFVQELAIAIALDIALPIALFAIQHGRMRTAQPQHNLCHESLSGFAAAASYGKCTGGGAA